MIKRWLDALGGTARETSATSAAPAFSLAKLARENPGLAAHFLWGANSMPPHSGELWLHLGCGERVLDGFVNLDFIPHDDRVIAWNVLDLWPDALTGRAAGVFSEDMLEHFFHAEQVYILCNVNRALQPGAVARTLMPSLSRLVLFSSDYKPLPDEFLHATFGVETGADALNIGMRFSGHRWLHDAQSLAHMAESCGFDVEATACATSTIAKFNGLNIRDENNSLSFAGDLSKVRSIRRTLLAPQSVSGARLVEEPADGTSLYVATGACPTVRYSIAQPVDSRALACINIRSSNLSSFDEHNQKTIVVDEVNRDKPWYFDETLKSRPCMNLVTRSEMLLILGGAQTFSALRFSPAARAGEYFTLGCAEIFALE